MDLLWFGFILGFCLFPILYAFVPAVFGISRKTKKFPVIVNSVVSMSENLKTEMKKSLVITENLGWINVMIQRLFFDSIRNYYLEHRIRQTIMKSFAASIGEGLLRNVRIKSINFGAEAPYLKSIKLITPEEYKNIIQSHILQTHTVASQPNSPFPGSMEIYSKSTDSNISQVITSDTTAKKNSSSTINSQSNELKSVKNEDLTFKKIFKNSTFFGAFEYNGNIQMMIEVELPKGILASLTVTFRKLFSDFLLRIPAINYSTRYEITLINNPILEIDVDSGLLTEFKKLYFQGSISGFIKRTTINSFKNTVAYPVWLQLAQPSTASYRFSPFSPDVLTFKNYSNFFETVDQILLITSSDFKQIDIKNEIMYKKSYSTLNDKNHVYSWCFKTTKNFDFKGEFNYFEGLSASESRVLYFAQTINGLRSIFPGLKGMSVIFEIKNLAIIKMIFEQCEQEYVKCNYKNNVILYKNCKKFSEFIVFSIQDSTFSIYNYSNKTSDLFFTDKRVEKLKKIFNEGISIAGNESKQELFKAVEENEINTSAFDVMFKEALRIDNGEFMRFACNLKIPKETLVNIVNDPEMRIKMFEEFGKLVGAIDETKEVKTLIIEYKSMGSTEIEELRIHSFSDKKFTVDICPERNQIFVYKIKKSIKTDNGNDKGNDNRNNNENVSEENEEASRPIEPNRRAYADKKESINWLNRNISIGSCLTDTSSVDIENSIHSHNINGRVDTDVINEEGINERINETVINKRINEDDIKNDGIDDNLIKEDNTKNNIRENVIKENDSAMIVNEREKMIKTKNNMVISKSSHLAESKLEILYKSSIPIFFPNFFIESIKIKETFQKYFDVIDQLQYSRSPVELILERYITAGTIYLEFKCDLEDDYSLEIFSCKKQAVIFHISKIITVKLFKMIYPVDNDYIKIYLVPKHKRNPFLEYKFREFPYRKDILVRGVIGLNYNEKFKLKIEGATSHVIFWEKSSLKPVTPYLQDVYGKTDINDCGILRADGREYVLALKNKSEKQRNIGIYAGLAEMR